MLFKDSSNQVVQQLTPKLVKNLSDYDIYKICPGQNHTAFIDGKIKCSIFRNV